MLPTWIACAREPASPPPVAPPTATTDATGVDTEPTEPIACANGGLPGTVRCTGLTGPATLTLSAAGAPTRTFDAPSAVAALVGYGLWADTTYDWTVRTGAETTSGAVTTAPLPDGLAGLDVEVSGTLFGADAVLVYVDCGWFVMLDTDGRVIWGAPSTTYDTFSDAMRWAPDERSVIAVRDATMMAGTSEVVETHVSGEELLHLSPGSSPSC